MKYIILILIFCFAISPALYSQKLEAYDQKIPGSDAIIKMAAIPGGSLIHESHPSKMAKGGNEPRKTEVELNAFWIGAYEITYDQYDIFSDSEKDGEPAPDAITRPSPPYIDLTLGMGKMGGYPANSMSQYGALMFCKWLYLKTHIFFRLPTEAEWEYAAGAGSATPYFFGTDNKELSKYAWFAANSENKYHKVGELKPNPWGLYDVYGNVSEWVLNSYDGDRHFKNDFKSVLLHSAAAGNHTLKGGNYKDAADMLESAARMKSDPDWNRRDPQIPKSKWWNADAPFIGFRILRPYIQPSDEEINQFFDKVLGNK